MPNPSAFGPAVLAISVAAFLAVGVAFAGANQGGPNAAMDSAQRCASLAQQWNVAEASASSSANLGRAKAKARSAAQSCASRSPAERQNGVSQYLAALKLLNVAAR